MYARCIYARIYAYMHTYMHICAHICIYACIYAYMHTYGHISIYIYIWEGVHTDRGPQRSYIYIYIYICFSFLFLVCIRIRNVSGVSRRHMLETSKPEQLLLLFILFRLRALTVSHAHRFECPHSSVRLLRFARPKVWSCRCLESVRGKHHYSQI